MIYILIASLVWAFSFGLIKDYLTGIDPNLVSFIRLVISFIFFLPFLKVKKLEGRLTIKLLFTGAVQFGLMYSAYIYSYKFLQAYEVALFTIFTPIFVIIISDILNKHFTKLFYLTSILAVLGTGVIIYSGMGNSSFMFGFLILQVSNICFAFGQIYYKKVMLNSNNLKDIDVFALLYGGAVLITFLFSAVTVEFKEISFSGSQLLVLFYLGLIPSGVCFFLWNYGARLVNNGALAILNNLKIPLAILVSLLIFNEEMNVLRLIIGGGIIFISLILNELLLSKKILL